MSDQELRTSEEKLQFRNGYAEVRGSDLFIAVDGYCKAMPLRDWLDAGWAAPRTSEANTMQDNVISSLLKEKAELTKECNDLREIALLAARAMR